MVLALLNDAAVGRTLQRLLTVRGWPCIVVDSTCATDAWLAGAGETTRVVAFIDAGVSGIGGVATAPGVALARDIGRRHPHVGLLLFSVEGSHTPRQITLDAGHSAWIVAKPAPWRVIEAGLWLAAGNARHAAPLR